MKRTFSLLIGLLFASIGLPCLITGAAGFTATEHQITSGSEDHRPQLLGRDAVGDYVVYNSWMPGAVPAFADPDVYLQRLVDGKPDVAPLPIAATSYHEHVNDVGGDYLLYTWYEVPTSSRGKIVLYQISTGQRIEIDDAADRWYPRIHNDVVVWLKATLEGNLLMMYRIGSGLPVQPVVLAGPSPSPKDLEVGDRFVVWSQLDYERQTYDVAAYDLEKGVSLTVANTPDMDERLPVSGGAWVVYQVQAHISATSIAIHAANLDTDETRTIADNGAFNGLPNIDGNFISYESNISGNWDVYIHRIAEGDTFQVTTRSDDQRLNDISGNLISYVDDRNGNLEVFVSSLCFDSAPMANAGPDQTAEQSSPSGALVTLDGTGSTGGCGELTYEWTWPGETATGAQPSVLMPPGTTTVTLTVRSGSESATDSVLITVQDTVKPITGAAVTGTAGSNNWYVSDAVVSLSSLDTGAGVREILYRINDGTWTIVAGGSASIILAADGVHVISYFAKDSANNSEGPQSITVKIDKTPPVITISGVQDGAVYEMGAVPSAGYDVSDIHSGVASSSATLSGGDGLGLGTFTYAILAGDNASNNAAATVTYTVVASPAGMIPVVSELANSGEITPETAAVLTSMLETIQAAPNDQARANKAKALINHIEAKAGKSITPEAAASLIKAVEAIIAP